jgi:hypothetical protein
MGYPIDTMLDFTELRTKQGSTGVVVAVMGGLNIPPQNYGFFYWKEGSYLPDDNKWYIRVTGITTGQWVRSPGGGLGGIAKLYYDQDYSFTSSTNPVIVSMNQEEYKEGDIAHDNITNPGRIIFPSRAGNAEFNIQANIFNDPVAGNMEFWVRKNGFNINNSRLSFPIAASVIDPITFTKNYQVAIGDYFEIIALPTDTGFKFSRSTAGGKPTVPAFQVTVKLFNQIVY